MFRKASLISSVFGLSLGFASLASAGEQATRIVFVGGHDPSRVMRIEPKVVTETAYSVTGMAEPKRNVRYEPIQVGSRIAGYRVVSN
jgi:hypothetical protein